MIRPFLAPTWRIAVILPLFAVLALSAASAHAASRWATLQAIHSLENPTDRTTPGPYGELGAYQFRQSTWRQYSRLPFSYALDRPTSDSVAIRHYERIKNQLERAGYPASTYNIALVWNGGLGAVFHHAPYAARDYARRANNLATSLDRNATASQ